MYQIQTKDGKTLHIAASAKDCTDSLFTAGGTVTNYIIKRHKCSIDLFVLGETYRLNKHGVFCLMTKQNGKPWFSFGGQLNRIASLQALSDLAHDIRRDDNYQRELNRWKSDNNITLAGA